MLQKNRQQNSIRKCQAEDEKNKLTKKNKRELKAISAVLILVAIVFLWIVQTIGLPIETYVDTQDMQEKFGMTLTAIYSFVSKNAIPKKKVGIMVYYSKKHVDLSLIHIQMCIRDSI